ncbi:MAG TPA: hypothetical protein VGX48_06825 [Pyrinomonadaceae bacterium]|nr:hypothetical protein [Pyrinomonadaceae bacterium]
MSEKLKAYDLGDDLEKSLRFAEELHEKTAEANYKILSSRIKEAFLFMISLLLNIAGVYGLRFFIEVNPTATKYLVISIILITLSIISYASYLEFRAQKLSRRVESDKERLGDLVDLLHETEKAISSDELSTLARETLRIRLSRFGIGTKAWK